MKVAANGLQFQELLTEIFRRLTVRIIWKALNVRHTPGHHILPKEFGETLTRDEKEVKNFASTYDFCEIDYPHFLKRFITL